MAAYDQFGTDPYQSPSGAPMTYALGLMGGQYPLSPQKPPQPDAWSGDLNVLSFLPGEAQPVAQSYGGYQTPASSFGNSYDALNGLMAKSQAERDRMLREGQELRGQAANRFSAATNTPAVDDATRRQIQANLMRRFGSMQGSINQQTREALGRSGISTGGRRVEMERRNLAQTGPSFASAYTQSAIQQALANSSARRQGLTNEGQFYAGQQPMGIDYSPEMAMEVEKLNAQRAYADRAAQADLVKRILGQINGPDAAPVEASSMPFSFPSEPYAGAQGQPEVLYNFAGF